MFSKFTSYCKHSGFWRYFSNQTTPPFIQDPFHHIILEEKGELTHHDLKRKVGFQELFYDLFVVAALNVYSSEDDLASGPSVAAYVVFFAAIWAIWASQTVFDVRYGTKDGMLWIFGYLQLCVFGVFAAVSGDFDLTMGFANFQDYGQVPDHHEYENITGLQHWIRRPAGELRNAQATLRSFKAASATFASSRVIVMIQYLIVLYYAHKHKRDKKPLYWHIGGLFTSACLWYAALAVSFSESEGAGIARLVLWTTGLAFEFACMAAAAATQPAYRLDLEYWAERFSALTLIVLGEGIISLFEAFRSVPQSVGTSVDAVARGTLAGLIFSAIGLYRLLYYLYFGQHTHHIKGGAFMHGLWGCLHFPLHLSMLLLTQCASHVIFATDVIIATNALMNTWGRLEAHVTPMILAGNLTEVQEGLLLSPEALDVQIVLANIHMDWQANVGNVLTWANGNLTQLGNLLTGEVFSSLSQLFATYHFEPTEEAYHLIASSLNEANETAALQFQDEYIVTLMKPVYVSMQYGITVLGGVFVCLGLLSLLQCGPDSFHHLRHAPHRRRSHMFYHRISMFYRLGLGIILLLLTMLDIGPFWRDADQTTPAAPIFTFLDNGAYLPTLFLIAVSAAIVDFSLFLWRQHHEKPHHEHQHSTHAEKVRMTETQTVGSIAVLPRLETSVSTTSNIRKDGLDSPK